MDEEPPVASRRLCFRKKRALKKIPALGRVGGNECPEEYFEVGCEQRWDFLAHGELNLFNELVFGNEAAKEGELYLVNGQNSLVGRIKHIVLGTVTIILARHLGHQVPGRQVSLHRGSIGRNQQYNDHRYYIEEPARHRYVSVLTHFQFGMQS